MCFRARAGHLRGDRHAAGALAPRGQQSNEGRRLSQRHQSPEKYNESPVFGLAGFVPPAEEVRGFGAWFFQRKCQLLDDEHTISVSVEPLAKEIRELSSSLEQQKAGTRTQTIDTANNSRDSGL